MVKIKKLCSTIAAVGVVAVGLGTYAQAATYKGYSTTVPIFNDYESSPLKKATTGSAYNDVSRIDNDKLVSWVENSSGSNVTSKVSYTSTGTKIMDYSSASTQKGKDLHLNISTSVGTISSVYTKGEWTPN
ncbi:hypothetical protein ACQKMD_21440 [Viridibacillus sp. NPDC096237]|uniref:hypothetical protein n=1 Tax=Viridibacillus sp. NPDC096237 TaxID=3390721 RepID=UPI003D0571C5